MRKITFGLLLAAFLTTGGCSGDRVDQHTVAQNRGNEAANRVMEQKQIVDEAAKEVAEQKQIVDEAADRVVAQKPILDAADRTFTLIVPVEAVTLTQGTEQTIRLGIKRGEDFREDVAIKLAEVPEGVSVGSTDIVILPGTMASEIVLKAKPDAALGDFIIKVTGHTTSGAEFATDLKVTVVQP